MLKALVIHGILLQQVLKISFNL